MIAIATVTTNSSSNIPNNVSSMVSLMSTSIDSMVSLKRSNNRSRNDCDGHLFLRRESKDTQCTEEPLLTVSSLGDVEEDSISFSSSSSLRDDEKVIQVELDTTVHSGAANSSASRGNTDLERPSLVQFSTVEIRSYRIVLGDNPSVTSGVPVTLDWLYDECMVCDVSDYEDSRPARRDRAQMMLPAGYRARLVMDTGSSRKEIQQRQKEVNIQRNQRRRTLELEHLDRLEEVMKRTWKILSGKKKREKKFIQQATSFAAVQAN